MSEAIKYQNDRISKQISQTQTNASTYLAKSKYQTNMYESVKYLNQFLMVIYGGLFIFIHGIFLHQYLTGVKRDEIADTVWLTVFFFYPYFIYSLEKLVYFGITYVMSLIYGQSYVFQFDRLFMTTDFYKNPEPAVDVGQLSPSQQ